MKHGVTAVRAQATRLMTLRKAEFVAALGSECSMCRAPGNFDSRSEMYLEWHHAVISRKPIQAMVKSNPALWLRLMTARENALFPCRHCHLHAPTGRDAFVYQIALWNDNGLDGREVKKFFDQIAVDGFDFEFSLDFPGEDEIALAIAQYSPDLKLTEV